MSANTSSAVMQQRHEPRDSLEDFPTPPWATRAFCEKIFIGGSLSCREPAANRGHMVKPLREYFSEVLASDVHDYGFGFEVRDYLFPEPLDEVDWTITNPPFRLAEEFILKALRESRMGVAVIVRSAFLESKGRHERLFKPYPPSHIFQFCERVVMHKGKLSPNGSTATSYSWVVWDHMRVSNSTTFDWIKPCRKRLEREGDYT